MAAEFIDFIKTPLIIGAVALTMRYLARQSKKEAATDAQGNLVLRLPAFYGVLGVGCCVLGVGALGLGLAHFGTRDFGPLLGIFALFAGLGLVLVLYRYVYQITLTPEGLVRRTIFGKYHSLAWAEVQTVSYHATLMELRLSDGTRQVKCYAHVVGFDTLVDTLARHLGKTRAEMGLPAL